MASGTLKNARPNGAVNGARPEVEKVNGWKSKKLFSVFSIVVVSLLVFSLFDIYTPTCRAEEKTNVAAIVTSISGALEVLPHGTEKWVEARKGMFLYEATS